MNLDLYTQYFFFGVIDLMQGISLYLLWRREKQPHLLLWGLGFGVSALGFLLVNLRHTPLAPLSVIIASGTLVTLGMALLHAGQCAVLRRPDLQGRIRDALRWSWPFALTVIQPLAMWLARSDADRVVQVHSAMLGLVAAFGLAALARGRDQAKELDKFGRSRRDPIIFWALLIVLMVTRVVLAQNFTELFLVFEQLIYNVLALQVLGMVAAHVGLFAAFMNMHTAALNAELRSRSTALENSLEQLRWISETDALTDLANRRKFNETLAAEWARAMRRGQPLALLMIDIDHFKLYNDHYGHPQGDRCLERVARVLSSSAQRPGDLAARYGGEEFALILPDTDSAGAERLAQKILDAVRAQRIPHAATPLPEGIVTLSIGVASQRPGKLARPRESDASVKQGAGSPSAAVTDMERFIKFADAALYDAKHQGRNRLAVAL
ncbi:GGDEF domain-containing protein [Hylemonella gracilis]|uniref:diguanylate cyclase n=1 Tax=Hylemonella gracilis ATCC 19624 TaxID=887062 RepID=F3KSR3_9BURK|nr:GGDEF domain-containing protein [Hylemonella gracilis]EGI77132.1 diguanylate cyclase [Hylemonella gracilis ATCC 19624]